MPFNQNLDPTANARMFLGGFSEGASAGASNRHLDQQQARDDQQTMLVNRQLAEQNAQDEVWRAVAEYKMNGLDEEDFAADHMPNSTLGQTSLAKGKGTGVNGPVMRAGAITPSMGQGTGGTYELPGTDMGAPYAGPMAAPAQGGAPGAVALPGAAAGVGPGTDAAAIDAATGQSLPGQMTPPPPPTHPDDTRLRRALQMSDARSIQQVLPMLEDERSRRSLTQTLRHIEDQGLEDGVITEPYKSIIHGWVQAHKPQRAIDALSKAYEENGRHNDMLDEIKARGDASMARAQLASDTKLQTAYIIHAKQSGQSPEQFEASLDGVPEPARTNLLTAFRVSGKAPTANGVMDALTPKNNPRDRLVATTTIADAKQSKDDAEKEYKSISGNLTAPTAEEMSLAARAEAPGWLESGNEKTWTAAKSKVEAWHKFEDAKQALHAANKKVIEGGAASKAAPAAKAAPGGQPSDEDLRAFMSANPGLSPDQLEAEWKKRNGG